MSDPTILEMLRSVTFFSGIADGHLEELAKIARAVEFPARHEIFREHDTAEDVYVIISGEVSLVICEPSVGCRQLMEVGAGGLVGWSPLVGRHRLSDTARTMSPTTAVAINGEKALALCSADPEFGCEFMHRTAIALAERLSATRLQLMKMSGFQLPDAQIESD